MSNALAPVSNSEIGAFQRCKRMWYLRYVEWYARPEHEDPPTGAMQLGTRMHAAFEGWIKSGRQGTLAYWADQVYGAEMLRRPEAAEDIRKERALAMVMAEGYERWAGEEGVEEGIEVISAEQDVQAEMPGMPGTWIRGRLDQMIRRVDDGAVLFRDWKTTGALEDAIRGMRLSPQMRFYTMLQRLATRDVRAEGGRVIFLRRSKQTVRASPPFYAMEEIRYNRDTLNATYLKVKALLTQMAQARFRLEMGAPDAHLAVTPPTPSWDCSWSCPFFFMCDMMDDGSNWRGLMEHEFTKADPYAYYERDLLGS